MGQYYLVVNKDKKEYIDPFDLGDAYKLMEAAFGGRTGAVLVLLLADGNGRGGGDYRKEHGAVEMVGRWAGDRIVVAGDYADSEEGCPDNLYCLASREGSEYRDITALCLPLLSCLE